MNHSYKCEIQGCAWTGMIRTRIKNKDSEHYGKMCCTIHAQRYNNYTKKYYTIKPKNKKPLERTELEEYFAYHIEKLQKGQRCEETNQYLEPSRMHICHIFPKRRYKSVSSNVINCVYLTWQAHADFDRMLDGHEFEKLEKEFPNCWSMVCTRAKILLPSITEEGKFKSEFEKHLKNK